MTRSNAIDLIKKAQGVDSQESGSGLNVETFDEKLQKNSIFDIAKSNQNNSDNSNSKSNSSDTGSWFNKVFGAIGGATKDIGESKSRRGNAQGISEETATAAGQITGNANTTVAQLTMNNNQLNSLSTRENSLEADKQSAKSDLDNANDDIEDANDALSETNEESEAAASDSNPFVGGDMNFDGTGSGTASAYSLKTGSEIAGDQNPTEKSDSSKGEEKEKSLLSSNNEGTPSAPQTAASQQTMNDTNTAETKIDDSASDEVEEAQDKLDEANDDADDASDKINADNSKIKSTQNKSKMIETKNTTFANMFSAKVDENTKVTEDQFKTVNNYETTGQAVSIASTANGAVSSAATIVGQAISNNPYTAAAGASLQTYGGIGSGLSAGAGAANGVAQYKTAEAAADLGDTTKLTDEAANRVNTAYQGDKSKDNKANGSNEESNGEKKNSTNKTYARNINTATDTGNLNSLRLQRV